MSTVQPPVQSLTTGPEVSFAKTNILPPSNLYVGREDIGSITSYAGVSGLTLEVHGRVLLPNGNVVAFYQPHVPNSNRTSKTDTFPIPEGFLLNIAVFLATGSAQRGQCYVAVKLGRGTATLRVDHQVILQGYVGNNVNQSWPGNRLETPTEGPGVIRSITGTTPGVGAECQEAVPTGARWRLLTVHLILAAAAVVASRRVVVYVSDGTTTKGFFPCTSVITSGQTRDITCANGLSVSAEIDQVNQLVPFPAQLYLGTGYKFGTQTESLQATDQYTAPTYAVEEWIEP